MFMERRAKQKQWMDDAAVARKMGVIFLPLSKRAATTRDLHKGIQIFAHSKVADAHSSVLAQKDIGRLDVSVHHVVGMQESHSL